MRWKNATRRIAVLPILTVALCVLAGVAQAGIIGVTGTNFTLTAKADTISTGDGDSMWMWGYAPGNGTMQYPGPTIIVNQGVAITVTLNNTLPVPVSIVFPGLNVTASGGNVGLLTREAPAAPPGGTTGPVTYQFTPSQPGTYLYHSGTQVDLEVEMGLVGAIIVRPTGFAAMNPKRDYADASTAFEQEYLFLLTEADNTIHQQVAFGDIAGVDMTKRRSVSWFMNGRNFPDTMTDAGTALFRTQPYNAMPMMHPADRVLIRLVAAGGDMHPFHTHGQNHLVIARDGNLLKTAAVTSPNLGVSDYTTTTIPGETVDAIWGPWTGAGLGWDVYGTTAINPHTCNNPTGFDTVTHEWCPDHNKAIPVQLPAETNLNFGAMFGGTPYLGLSGTLPVLNPDGTVHVQQNPMAGFSFMWHSHSERELTTNDIFIGGMATMALVLPVTTPIP